MLIKQYFKEQLNSIKHFGGLGGIRTSCNWFIHQWDILTLDYITDIRLLAVCRTITKYFCVAGFLKK